MIVKDDKIVSEGYHEKYGGPHAEVNAINNLPEEINPIECTLYVNLEPCSHHGKTPPCADLIIKKGFKKVVISNLDPNPLVAGKGVQKLKEASIEVVSGICEKEGFNLNKTFFTYHQKKRPFITLKWAQSKDGFISKLPVPVNRNENFISCDKSNVKVHQLRSYHDAILVGKNTVIADNPKLNVRLVEGRNPVRIVLGELAFDEKLNVFSNETKTIVIGPLANNKIGIHEWIQLKNDAFPEIMSILYNLGISSILVEGGTNTLQRFIDVKLFDEIYIIENQHIMFLNGVLAPNISLPSDFQELKDDRWYYLETWQD